MVRGGDPESRTAAGGGGGGCAAESGLNSDLSVSAIVSTSMLLSLGSLAAQEGCGERGEGGVGRGVWGAGKAA